MERRVTPKRKTDRGTGMETQRSKLPDAGLIRLREAIVGNTNGDTAEPRIDR